jgi:hypothetical protein
MDQRLLNQATGIELVVRPGSKGKDAVASTRSEGYLF